MPEVNPSKYYTTASMYDVPHLDAATIAEMEKDTPIHLQRSRVHGEPSLGSGAIYPILPEEIRCPPFMLPDYWPRAYGFDPGWNRTAAVWGAHDRDNDVIYLYGEHYRGQAEPSIHADAIKNRGLWMPGIADYAGRSIEGERVIDRYRALNLNLVNADKSVDAGLMEVLQRLSTGRLKVFSTLSNWFEEYKVYHRNEKGAIVKLKDHLMDATRYLVMGQHHMIIKPITRTNMNSSFHALDGKTGY